jgi:hypothetical protein
VFIWFAAGSVAIVWLIFQSPAIDYRMVMLGAVAPALASLVLPGVFETLLAPVLALIVVMGATVGRRLVRRRWLGVPIGMFLYLVLNGSWMQQKLFWWPAFGTKFPSDGSPIVQRGIWSVLLELAGVAIAVWLFTEFGLDDSARRTRFLREGQLDRSYVRHRRQGYEEDSK